MAVEGEDQGRPTEDLTGIPAAADVHETSTDQTVHLRLETAETGAGIAMDDTGAGADLHADVVTATAAHQDVRTTMTTSLSLAGRLVMSQTSRSSQ